MARTKQSPPLDWCVVGTLAWFGVLGRPLRLEELRALLLKEAATSAELESVLGELEDTVVTHEGWYSLSGQPVRYPDATHEKHYRYKWWRVRLAVGLLRHIPYVRLVAVANTLADRTASPDSDIDVLIVIKHGRLFLTRTLVTAALQFAALRRHGNKVTDRICLSFFITNDALDLSGVAFSPYDIYLAYWLRGLIPVLESGSTFADLQHANGWTGAYIPDRRLPAETTVPRPSWTARIAEPLLDNPLGTFMERRLQAWQLRRIDRRSADRHPDVHIVANDRMLKFHEKERRRQYRESWEAAMRQRGYDPILIQGDG